MKPDTLIPEPLNLTKLPVFGFNLPAGFPSPCGDHVQPRLNVHEFLVSHETSTFFAQVMSEALIDIGILPKDRVVLDRSLSARPGDIVLAVVDGNFTIRILQQKGNKAVLLPANEAFLPVIINENMEFEIWAVVTGVFRKVERP